MNADIVSIQSLQADDDTVVSKPLITGKEGFIFNKIKKNLFLLMIIPLLVLVLFLIFSPTKYFSKKTDNSDILSDSLEFDKFINLYTKIYTNEEYDIRLLNFQKNKKYIDEQNNNASNTFKLALNKFADLSEEEIYTQILPPLKNQYNSDFKIKDHAVDFDLKIKYKNLNSQESYGKLDEMFYYFNHHEEFEFNNSDLRANGRIPPIKDQGPCGSCWIFSAVGTVEGSYLLNNPSVETVNYSEQEFIDCLLYNGCFGGFPEFAFERMLITGVSNQEDYEYIAEQNDQCLDDVQHTFPLLSFAMIKPYSAIDIMIASTYTPVSVAVCASLNWVFYKSGVLNETCENEYSLNHAVIVVGYDYDKESNEGSFIVRNSWGESWGDNGYIRIAILKDDLLGASGIHIMPTIAFTSSQ